MSLLDRLIRGLKAEDVETFSRTPSSSSASSALDPELTRRVETFRAQLAAWPGPGVPLLTLPDAPEPRQGRCVSCGEEIPDGWRCALCLRSVYLALGITMPEEGA